MRRKCSSHVWDVFRTCSGHVFKMCRKCEWTVARVFGTSADCEYPIVFSCAFEQNLKLFWESNSTHMSDTYYSSQTQRIGTSTSQEIFSHAYTENWIRDPSIQRTKTLLLNHAEGWKHRLSGWCLFYNREQVIHAGSGARFSVELGQWEGFELSVRSIFFPSTFYFPDRESIVFV